MGNLREGLQDTLPIHNEHRVTLDSTKSFGSSKPFPGHAEPSGLPGLTLGTPGHANDTIPVRARPVPPRIPPAPHAPPDGKWHKWLDDIRIPYYTDVQIEAIVGADEEMRSLYDDGVITWRKLATWRWWAQWWKYYLFLVPIIVVFVLLLVYKDTVVVYVEPYTAQIRDFPASWVIGGGLLGALNIPPLLGADMALLLIGVIWAIWGLAIAAGGVFIGEAVGYLLYKVFLGPRALRLARTNIFLACTLLAICPPLRPDVVARQRGFVSWWTDQGLWIATVIRLTVLPSHYTTPLLAAGGMSFTKFMVSVVFSIPFQFAEVLAGYQLTHPMTNQLLSLVTYVTYVITVLASTWGFYFIYKRFLRQRKRAIVEQAAFWALVDEQRWRMEHPDVIELKHSVTHQRVSVINTTRRRSYSNRARMDSGAPEPKLSSPVSLSSSEFSPIGLDYDSDNNSPSRRKFYHRPSMGHESTVSHSSLSLHQVPLQPASDLDPGLPYSYTGAYGAGGPPLPPINTRFERAFDSKPYVSSGLSPTSSPSRTTPTSPSRTTPTVLQPFSTSPIKKPQLAYSPTETFRPWPPMAEGVEQISNTKVTLSDTGAAPALSITTTPTSRKIDAIDTRDLFKPKTSFAQNSPPSSPVSQLNEHSPLDRLNILVRKVSLKRPDEQSLPVMKTTSATPVTLSGPSLANGGWRTEGASAGGKPATGNATNETSATGAGQSLYPLHFDFLQDDSPCPSPEMSPAGRRSTLPSIDESHERSPPIRLQLDLALAAIAMNSDPLAVSDSPSALQPERGEAGASTSTPNSDRTLGRHDSRTLIFNPSLPCAPTAPTPASVDRFPLSPPATNLPLNNLLAGDADRRAPTTPSDLGLHGSEWDSHSGGYNDYGRGSDTPTPLGERRYDRAVPTPASETTFYTAQGYAASTSQSYSASTDAGRRYSGNRNSMFLTIALDTHNYSSDFHTPRSNVSAATPLSAPFPYDCSSPSEASTPTLGANTPYLSARGTPTPTPTNFNNLNQPNSNAASLSPYDPNFSYGRPRADSAATANSGMTDMTATTSSSTWELDGGDEDARRMTTPSPALVQVAMVARPQMPIGHAY